MKHRHPMMCLSLVTVLLLAACTSRVATEQTPPATESKATEVLARETPAAFPDTFILSEKGPYHTGRLTFTVEDASQDDRQMSITVWYPAVRPENNMGSLPTRDAEPDLSGAPYPLILSSTKVATIFAPFLISHGFAWASLDGIDTYAEMGAQIFEQPLGLLFVLRQVATNPPINLAGVIDADRAGAIGYSFDGTNALVLGGARIDPEYYLAQCALPGAAREHPLSAFSCNPARNWLDFTNQAGEEITASQDGLWHPITDARIQAVIPMAGEGWWLFGERGLAAVDKPVLMMVGTHDELYPENALIFEHLGSLEKALISFVGQDHMMVYKHETVAQMAHFVVAFFGCHLQSRKDLAWYFSEDFIAKFGDLYHGLYQD